MAVISILIVIVSILLILVVLVQNSKGGGLDSNLASQSQAFGAKKTTEIVEKVTWWLAGILIILSIASTKLISGGSDEELEGDEVIENAEAEGEEEGDVNDEEAE